MQLYDGVILYVFILILYLGTFSVNFIYLLESFENSFFWWKNFSFFEGFSLFTNEKNNVE